MKPASFSNAILSFFLGMVNIFILQKIISKSTAVSAGHFIAWIEAKYEQSTHQEIRYLNFDKANCKKSSFS